MRHFIYIYKGKVFDSEKNWTFERIESVLKRLGATHWEIEIGKVNKIENLEYIKPKT